MRRSPRALTTIATAGLALAAVAAVAPAQTAGDRASFSFTTKSAGKAAGFKLDATVAPRDLDGVDVRFPAGTKVDLRAVTACKLSQGGPGDPDLTGGDPFATCPASSKVATGKLRIVNSRGGAIAIPNGQYDVNVFARSGGKTYVTLSKGKTSQSSADGRISSSGFDLAVIPTAARQIDQLKLVGRNVTKGPRKLFTTPKACGASRKLTARLVVDPVEGEPKTTSARSTCAR